MLHLLLIHKSDSFFEYMKSHDWDNAQVVCPNPATADLVRKKAALFGVSLESITISKFIRDQLQLLEIENLADQYRGKSELILTLGAIWSKLNKSSSYGQFKKAFNLFTEIRSFSLSEQVLSEVLENYEKEIAENVIWIHRFVEQLEIIDEHRSYFLFSEILRSQNIPVGYPEDRKIIFYQFDFLTGSQLDLLRSLALRDQVFIPIAKKVYEKSTALDWTKWFDDHNTKITDIGEESSSLEALKCSYFPKGYLNKAISFQLDSVSSVVIGSKELNRDIIQEIPHTDAKFKVSLNIYEDQYKKVSQVTRNFFKSEIHNIDFVRDFMARQIEASKLAENFLQLKCYLLLLAKINYWAELSEDNIKLGEFESELILDSASLDLPRINLANLQKSFKRNIFNLNQLGNINAEDCLMVFSSHFPPISASGSRYTENVEKYLGAIGPIRRSEFEIELLKARLVEFFNQNQVKLLIEEGLLEHNLTLNSLLEDYDLQRESLEINFEHLKSDFNQLEGKYHLESLSSSKLQKYRDCPLKFYVHYGENLKPLVKYNSELLAMELGSLEHKVIEKYFEKVPNQENEFKPEVFTQIIDFEFGQALAGKACDPFEIKKYHLEIKNYTLPAIKFLLQLREIYKLKYQFELRIDQQGENLKYVGSIDCFAESDSHVFVLDFKRSSTSFQTYKMIEEYEQIQLWFYAQRMKDQMRIFEKKIVFGYIDLSDLNNTTLFGNNEDHLTSLKRAFNLSKVRYWDDFETRLDNYFEIENECINEINTSTRFPAAPKNSHVCHFCAIEKVCSKGGIDA